MTYNNEDFGYKSERVPRQGRFSASAVRPQRDRPHKGTVQLVLRLGSSSLRTLRTPAGSLVQVRLLSGDASAAQQEQES